MDILDSAKRDWRSHHRLRALAAPTCAPAHMTRESHGAALRPLFKLQSTATSSTLTAAIAARSASVPSAPAILNTNAPASGDNDIESRIGSASRPIRTG